MKQLDTNLWIADQDLKILSTNFGCRMTVIKTSEGLVVYSPIRMTESIKTAVEKLGPVTYLIAPNPFHHLFLDAWISAYPQANLIGPQALVKKRPKLQFNQFFESQTRLTLPKELSYTILVGRKDQRELILFDQSSASLLVADMIFNLKAQRWWDKILFAPLGVKNKAGTSTFFRFFYPVSAQIIAAKKDILSWPFKRIIVTHGSNIEHNARPTMEQALTWI